MVAERSNALVNLITSTLELKVEGSNLGGRILIYFRDLCVINSHDRARTRMQPQLSVPIYQRPRRTRGHACGRAFVAFIALMMYDLYACSGQEKGIHI